MIGEVPEHIFRANDIRGIADKDLSNQVVAKITKAFIQFLSNKGIKNIGVGRDVRLTSKRISDVVLDVLTVSEFQVFDLGITPSPVAYFTNFSKEPLDAVIIITASHNPPDYNGLKFCVQGNSLSKEDIQTLYKSALTSNGDFVKRKGELKTRNILEEYLNYLSEKFKFKNSFKVVVDPANATGTIVAPRLLRSLNQEISVINEEIDGHFPNHHPDPTVRANLEQLSAEVKELQADVGFGFDGDADRIGVVDDLGRFIPGDVLTALFAKDIVSNHPGASIVIEVKSSRLLIDAIEGSGGKVCWSKVGHGFIKKSMKESGALLAGELSGHMFFKDEYFGYDDAFYCMLRLLQLMEQKEKPLSQLVDEFPKYYNTPEIHLVCENDDEKFQLFKEIETTIKQKYDQIDTTDGVRVNLSNGWALVRPSNTQPVIVTRYEGVTLSDLEKIKQEITDLIHQYFKGKVVEL